MLMIIFAFWGRYISAAEHRLGMLGSLNLLFVVDVSMCFILSLVRKRLLDTLPSQLLKFTKFTSLEFISGQ